VQVYSKSNKETTVQDFSGNVDHDAYPGIFSESILFYY